MMVEKIRIGVLGYEGITALDLAGPVEVFTTAKVKDPAGRYRPCYEVVIIGLDAKPFTAESGIVFKPHTTIDKAPALDTLIIPGGRGLRTPVIQRRAAAWVAGRAPETRRIASVCTGIYALAAAGLLNNRRVTTHWRYARDLSDQFPQVNVDPDPLYLQDGPFYTCAGVASGIDLSLALVEADFGPQVALAVARELVVYLKRPGTQEQFSEPLQIQMETRDRFADLAAWIQGHLRQDLSIARLAERACLSPRHFTRRFKDAFGESPASFVERIRLGRARDYLTAPGQTIEKVASSVGYASADAFRRAFERRFGVGPGTYRKYFQVRPLTLVEGRRAISNV